MRLHRFFITPPARSITVGEEVTVSDADVIHQWRNVFRFKGACETVILLDNSGAEHTGEIVSLEKNASRVKIIQSKNKEQKFPHITLFQSVIKGDHFDLVLLKCTELGVSQFVPIVADRSEKKNINLERARKIVKEASEQSGKTRLPSVREVATLDEALKNFIAEEYVALDFTDANFSAQNFFKKNLGVYIGPEGGWTDSEREFFTTNNVPLLSLGEQVLRSETAAIAVSSILLLNS